MKNSVEGVARYLKRTDGGVVLLRSILLIFFLPLCAFSDIYSCLKKAEGKSDHHKIDGIDFIYMINLDQRPEKWEMSSQQLNPYGIFPYRFSAVNGWELSLEQINSIGLKFTSEMEGGYWGTSYLLDGNFEPYHSIIEQKGRTYFCHCMARGTIGIVLSHLSVLKDALEDGHYTIWVMEDDIAVIRDPRVLSTLIAELDDVVGKGNWDVLFTDQDIKDSSGNYVRAYGMAKRPNFHPINKGQYDIWQQINRNFIRTGARFGAHSMILRRSGIEKIFNFIIAHSIFFPYDMDYHLPPGIKMYSLVNDVVSNLPKALSDNGGPNYLK